MTNEAIWREPDPGEARIAPKEKLPLQGLQILLVEDEPDMAELLMFILRLSGAEITHVTHVYQALEEIEYHCPDVLICNVRLPDLDGDRLIEQIRAQESEQLQKLPAIAITSFTREVSTQKMLAAGFHGCLHKPIDPDQLIAAILEITSNK